MTELGKLKATHPGGLAELTGYIETVEMRYVVRIIGDETLYDGRKPSHRIYSRTRSGTEVEIGQAWLKKAKRGPTPGRYFFSITIDHPGVSRPLNVSAFYDAEADEWRVVWRRRGPHSEAQDAA